MTGTACYIYGPAGKLAKRTTIEQESNIFYYHTDHLGSTRLVTDENRNIVAAATYHPFGGLSAEEGLKDYLYTGKEKDATGLYYYGARYYDPDVGRFLTRDPLKGDIFNSQSLNRYTYCLNNPLKYTDPSGLLEKKFVMDGGGEAKKKKGSTSSSNPSQPTAYPGPIQVIPHGKGFLQVEGDYIRQGNVGVAVAWYHAPKRGGGFEEGEYGLAILIFEGDEIVDILFTPFDTLEEEIENDKGRELIQYISAWLSVHESDIYDFKDTLEELAGHCGDLQDDYTAASLIIGLYGIVIGYCCFWASIPPAIAAAWCGRRASMYDNWEDLSFKLGYRLPTHKTWRDFLR